MFLASADWDELVAVLEGLLWFRMRDRINTSGRIRGGMSSNNHSALADSKKCLKHGIHITSGKMKLLNSPYIYIYYIIFMVPRFVISKRCKLGGS